MAGLQNITLLVDRHKISPNQPVLLGPGSGTEILDAAITGLVASGDKSMIGRTKARPASTLPEIAHWALIVAMAPISKVPSGVPAPMQTLSKPIILHRISGGAASMVIVLCMVLNPAWPMPPMVRIIRANAYQGDQANNSAVDSTPMEPRTKTLPK